MDRSEQHDFAERVRECAHHLAQHGVGALSEVYDLTASRLIRYAATLTRHRDDAEDALQAALVRVALRPSVLAKARFPWAYLLKITRNEALNIVRRRRTLQRLAEQTAPWVDQSLVVGDADLYRFVRRALEKLPPAQAEVVVLKIWEEMTFAEIGEVLGQSPNTAASRYRYALQKLAQLLHAVGHEVLNG